MAMDEKYVSRPRGGKTSIDHERLAELMRERTEDRLAEAADHPNPAIRIHEMLPGTYYGAVFDGDRIEGYEIGNPGQRARFIRADVIKRLAKDGKVRLVGDGAWVTSDPDWGVEALP